MSAMCPSQGQPWWQAPSRPGSAELDGAELLQLLEAMAGVDQPGRPRLRPHDERLRGGSARVVVDPLEDLAVGDAGDGEEAVVSLHEVVGGEHPLEVVPRRDGG